MKIDDISELYDLISRGTENLSFRRKSILLRKEALNSCLNSGFNKIAFDTRRIDQETEYNPRRNLQKYNRSEQFISDILNEKLKNFAKIKNVLHDLKQEYGKEHEWQDSNARILLSTLDVGLRTFQKDGDYAISQPSQGSLDYIEELLHVRYRLSFDDVVKLGEQELRKIILSKDEKLIHKDINKIADIEFTNSDITSKTYDQLIDKLFGDVRATKDNKSVERTVTITIKDTFLDGQDK